LHARGNFLITPLFWAPVFVNCFFFSRFPPDIFCSLHVFFFFARSESTTHIFLFFWGSRGNFGSSCSFFASTPRIFSFSSSIFGLLTVTAFGREGHPIRSAVWFFSARVNFQPIFFCPLVPGVWLHPVRFFCCVGQVLAVVVARGVVRSFFFLAGPGPTLGAVFFFCFIF